MIEFPGVARPAVPEWRKELSERVREVQERRAREAAREDGEVAPESTGSNETDVAIPQLELLPHAELPPVNPLVAAALKRIERAHRPARASAAVAVAYAPSREENELAPEGAMTTPDQIALETGTVSVDAEVELEPKLEKSHGLVVVAAVAEPEVIPEPPSPPKRLIVDDDPVLNYLDSISRTVRVDEVATRRAPMFKRLVCGITDLIVCVLLTSPVAAAMKLSGADLYHDPRAIGVIAACGVIMCFIYLTLTTALTGRTWAMRMLRLRVIDIKTGLIPTGGQSAGRALIYLISLATAGLGILFALISREGNTAHDRFSRTAVIAV